MATVSLSLSPSSSSCSGFASVLGHPLGLHPTAARQVHEFGHPREARGNRNSPSILHTSPTKEVIYTFLHHIGGNIYVWSGYDITVLPTRAVGETCWHASLPQYILHHVTKAQSKIILSGFPLSLSLSPTYFLSFFQGYGGGGCPRSRGSASSTAVLRCLGPTRHARGAESVSVSDP